MKRSVRQVMVARAAAAPDVAMDEEGEEEEEEAVGMQGRRKRKRPDSEVSLDAGEGGRAGDDQVPLEAPLPAC
jgi:hypothetical protein